MSGLGSARNLSERLLRHGNADCGVTPLVLREPEFLINGNLSGMGGSINLRGTALAAIGTLRCTFSVPGAAKKESLVTWV
jgi:hypothetical protein